MEHGPNDGERKQRKVVVVWEKPPGHQPVPVTEESLRLLRAGIARGRVLMTQKLVDERLAELARSARLSTEAARRRSSEGFEGEPK